MKRPELSEADAELIARELYGLDVGARELGSYQDRNFVLEAADGTRSVLRIDNPAFADEVREAQFAALGAYRAAGVSVPEAYAGLDGRWTQRWRGLAVRRSEFAAGEPMVDLGYFAPSVLEDFGRLSAASVRALASLEHPGLHRAHMWDMRVAHTEVVRHAEAISDSALRDRVLERTAEAQHALDRVAESLPVQAIHGDLTDDNVMGGRGSDARLHPDIVLDLGDLGLGWRVAELAVTATSMLHHEPSRPMRVLDTVAAFYREVTLQASEARAVWPLIVLRSALLVASGWQQLQIDGSNGYARDRVAAEQAMFEAATSVSLTEGTEQVLARIGMLGVARGTGLQLEAAPSAQSTAADPLRSILPQLAGEVVVLDPGVESGALDGGRWLESGAEERLALDAIAGGAAAAVFPYGVFRLTRAAIDATHAAATWPIATEVWLGAGEALGVTAPITGSVQRVSEQALEIVDDSGWRVRIEGAAPHVGPGDQLTAGASIGSIQASAAPRVLTVFQLREDAPAALTAAQASGEVAAPSEVGAPLVVPDRVPAWARLSRDPAPLLGLASRAQTDESGAELLRREEIFASAQERYYERPMQVERGWRHHLVDTTARAYVDLVNNVAGLGHGHPGVAAAASQQLRTLGTNSRFLYRDLAEYSERLLALLPASARSAGEDGRDALDTVLLVNSGSEAVDLSLRLAQAATGRRTIVALREAYHGWTFGADAVTTSAADNPHALDSGPDWVHIADIPNRFRGTYRGGRDDPALGALYAWDLAAELDELAASGKDAAGFICESVLGNAGGVLLPDGYLGEAYAAVRVRGGLCIADEVQVGFGRLGETFWGFERSGVVPDIITIAKPMGNGFPIGGVITSRRIADSLATQGQFFSSAGGNPVSCRVGIAVLDAMERERLQENARVVGRQLADGFRALGRRHSIIRAVHGEGLYLGVELVRDRDTMEPAAAEAAAISERLRELGVIVTTTSERSNVLKVKPPLCITEESADFAIAALDRVLNEGW